MKRDLARAIRQRNIEEICWLLLKDELKLIDKGDDPNLGKTTFMKLIDKIASFEQVRQRGETQTDSAADSAQTREAMRGSNKNLEELVKWANA